MKVEKINNFKVKPLITHTKDKDDVLGGKLFLDPFSNCCIISKKKSGKSTVLFSILKKVTRGGKFATNVVIFCSTVFTDPTWKMIVEMLEKKDCNVSCYTNFIEDGENILKDLIKELNTKNQPNTSDVEKEIEAEQSLLNCLMFGKGKIKPKEESVEKEVKIRAPKKISAEFLFVFDDLGSDLKSETVANLSKVIRHHGRAFYSTQFLTDLTPSCRKQMDYALIFRSFNEDILKSLFESLDLSIDFETFVKIYNYATKDPFNFLYIDVRENKFRKNFNEQIILES